MRYQKKCPGGQTEARNLNGASSNCHRTNFNATVNNGQGDYDLISSALLVLDSTRADDRENWWRVGMAVHAGTDGSNAGFALWDSWSQQSEKYQPSACLQQWRSFKSDGKVGLGTLIHMADSDSPGWRNRPNQPGRRWFPKNPHLPQSPPQTSPNKPLKRPKTYPTAYDAIGALESYMGPASRRWEYLDAEWQTCGFVLRWDTPDGKTYRPVSRGFDGLWYCGAMTEPRPIYNLPYIRESGFNEPVIICEGEKDCDTFDSCGLIATTSSGGSQAAKLTDWSPLAGRDVIICPDNDSAGKKYAQTVCMILQRLKPPAKMRIFSKPELAPKDSIADWLVAKLANGGEVK
jgi:hypothetical protein